MKKVNENSPALRENSPAPRSFFGGQTAPSPAHCERSAQIICISNMNIIENRYNNRICNHIITTLYRLQLKVHIQYNHNTNAISLQYWHNVNTTCQTTKNQCKYGATSFISQTIRKLSRYNLNCFNAYFTWTKH